MDNMDSLDGKFKVLKDDSQPEISEEIEEFMQDNNIPYISVLGRSEQVGEIPAIHPPKTSPACQPYVGEGGFNIFKNNYQEHYKKQN